MIIETLFNVGDIVWTKKEGCVDCFVVGKIMAGYNDDDNGEKNVLYARHHSFHFVFEQDCFATKEEAEIGRRNNVKK